jgi:S-methylmethionine-dependent homocysteine/selenocysteine methylase
MIENEQRQLKTVTFRNLDSKENTDVAKIINDCMQEFQLKSVQKTLETIIRRYARDKIWNKERIDKLEDDLGNKTDLIKNLEFQLEYHKTITDSFKYFQNQLNKL